MSYIVNNAYQKIVDHLRESPSTISIREIISIINARTLTPNAAVTAIQPGSSGGKEKELINAITQALTTGRRVNALELISGVYAS